MSLASLRQTESWQWNTCPYRTARFTPCTARSLGLSQHQYLLCGTFWNDWKGVPASWAAFQLKAFIPCALDFPTHVRGEWRDYIPLINDWLTPSLSSTHSQQADFSNQTKAPWGHKCSAMKGRYSPTPLVYPVTCIRYCGSKCHRYANRKGCLGRDPCSENDLLVRHQSVSNSFIYSNHQITWQLQPVPRKCESSHADSQRSRPFNLQALFLS